MKSETLASQRVALPSPQSSLKGRGCNSVFVVAAGVQMKILVSILRLLIVLALTSWCSPAGAQTKPVAIVRATLIDGAGRAPVTDSVVIVRDGKFQAIGKRGEVQIPQDAEVIEAAGKSILPGFIDGHCHYRDWMGE